MEPTPETTFECAKFVAVVSDIAVAGAAMFAAWIAHRGLSAWNTELKGKSRYQLATETLSAVFAVRDSIRNARHPLILSSEYPEEFQTNLPVTAEQKAEASAHVFTNRLIPVQEAFRELEGLHIQLQVQWGTEFETKIFPLRACRGDLIAAIQETVEATRNPDDYRDESKADRAKRRHTVFFVSRKSEYGEFDKKLDEAVKEFDNWLRPIIER